MARKASNANAEVRECGEQLKIKELTILDLTKKQQELQVTLGEYKNMYEMVKSEKNQKVFHSRLISQVNQIQNSAQDLAELKERIKILQNELAILKNESLEKVRTMKEYSHILHK